MNIKDDNELNITLFIALCCIVYFSSYITRINYGATIAEIISSLNLTKTLASMVVTGSFITYGAGQILNGFIGDYIKPRTMIFYGLAITSTCNLIMASLSNIYIMTAIWCVNGFAQSMMWPPLTRIMVENLSQDNYKKACVAVSAAASVAIIFTYIFVPLCITLLNWRWVFLLSAVWGAIIGLLWIFQVDKLIQKIGSNDDRATLTQVINPSIRLGKLLVKSGLIPITLVIVLQGILRDGITTWMPSYIDDIYNLGTSISILTAAILPIFSIISVFISSYIHRKIKSELISSLLFWIVGLLSCLILVIVYASQATISILMMSIITGCMHGINLMLIGILPSQFKNTGRVSTVSGIINAFTYVGSAISTYAIAALSDNYGWKITILTWCGVLILGIIINTISIKLWHSPSDE